MLLLYQLNESEQIKYTIDKNDKIIDGNKEVSEIIKDKWVLKEILHQIIQIGNW